MKNRVRLLVTSIVRYASQEKASGFVQVIDFENKQVLMRAAVPESVYRAGDSNPRGGLRGARGVAIYEDRLVIANAERLLIFDSAWKLVAEITHPWMGGIHDILAEEDGIWVTCTSADLLLKVDWSGRVLAGWEWRLAKNLLAQLGFRKLARVDRNLDYRNPESMRNGVRNIIHLNAVNRGPDGLLLSFGRILSIDAYKKMKVQSLIGSVAKTLSVKRRGPSSLAATAFPPPASRIDGSSWAIVRLREDGCAQILKHATCISVPNHNVIQNETSLVYNDSNNNALVAAELNGSSPDRKIAIPGQPGFVRGLAQLNKDTFLVGSQAPAAVYQVNVQTNQLETIFLLDGEPNESVYGICLVPPHFDDPPAQLM